MHGRQQRKGADWQGGTGRRARWAAAAWEDAHAGGKRERARAGGRLQVLSARNQGGSGVYIGMERGFLACVPREESGCGSGCREKKNGPSCWPCSWPLPSLTGKSKLLHSLCSHEGKYIYSCADLFTETLSFADKKRG